MEEGEEGREGATEVVMCRHVGGLQVPDEAL